MAFRHTTRSTSGQTRSTSGQTRSTSEQTRSTSEQTRSTSIGAAGDQEVPATFER